MKPINLIDATSVVNSNSAIEKTDTVSHSLATDLKEKLIQQWKYWAGQSEPGKREIREIALLRLIECLETASDTLCIDSLNLTSLPDNFPPTIKFLYINHNQLTSLPNNLPNSLKRLRANNNQLTALPENLPSSLKSLNVDRNQLTSFPENLSAPMVELRARYNRLATLPNQLPPSLKKLYVDCNELTRMPENLPPSLKILSVDHNQLTSFPENLPDFLEDLHVRHNRLASLPNQLPPSLQRLYVDYNELTTVPENLPSSLKELVLRHNQLTILSENLPDSIEKIDVSQNRLTELPQHLPGTLEQLIVFQNRLNSLPESLPPRLVLLVVGENRLTTLPENLPGSLKELHAQDNLLTVLPHNLPESLVVLCVNDNLLTVLPENLSDTLQELDISYNKLGTLPEIAFNQDTMVTCLGNPIIEREVGILFGFLEAYKLWSSQKIDKEELKSIVKEDNLLIFSDFLTTLCDLKNSKSDHLKSIVSPWLKELFNGQNEELRKQTFAVATLGTESCVDRASYYFNQMYSLMISHRLIKNNVPVEETFQTLRGLFRLQELEKISATKVQTVKQRAEEFSEDIEIYLAYQYLLRDVLALPIHTELQYVGIARLSEKELEEATTQVIETEKQDFLRFLVNDSEIWREKIKSWNDTKLESADNQILEEIDYMISEESASNSYEVSIKGKTDELRYKVYLPLTQEFLKAHGELRLLDEFTSK